MFCTHVRWNKAWLHQMVLVIFIWHTKRENGRLMTAITHTVIIMQVEKIPPWTSPGRWGVKTPRQVQDLQNKVITALTSLNPAKFHSPNPLPGHNPPLTWYIGLAGSELPLLPPPLNAPVRALPTTWPTAEPTATPAAVVAIWAMRPGPWDWAGAVARAAGGGGAGAGTWDGAGLQTEQTQSTV